MKMAHLISGFQMEIQQVEHIDYEDNNLTLTYRTVWKCERI